MQRPEALATVLAAGRDDGRPLHVVEHEQLGVTHAEVGAYLLSLWRLPPSIVEAVAHHHAPFRLEAAGLTPGAAVYIADRLVAEQETPADARVEDPGPNVQIPAGSADSPLVGREAPAVASARGQDPGQGE